MVTAKISPCASQRHPKVYQGSAHFNLCRIDALLFFAYTGTGCFRWSATSRYNWEESSITSSKTSQDMSPNLVPTRNSGVNNQPKVCTGSFASLDFRGEERTQGKCQSTAVVTFPFHEFRSKGALWLNICQNQTFQLGTFPLF